jgi:hypothetical protein
MTYQKTVELWRLSDAQIAALQPGQWVTCGGTRGRFVGLNAAGAVWVTHWDGKTVPMWKFRTMRKSLRGLLRSV